MTRPRGAARLPRHPQRRPGQHRLRQLGGDRRIAPYTGTLGNVTPKGPAGALELLLRYSDLDLNDAGLEGGYQHDWTVGANYYFTSHFKVQVNYIKANSRRAGVEVDPNAFGIRAQVMF